MTIQLYMGSFAPREGGAERQFRHLGTEFARLGEPLTVLTQRIEGTSRHEVVDGCDVHRLGSSTLFDHYPYLAHAAFVLDAVLLGIRLPRPAGVISVQLGSATAAATVVGFLRQTPRAVRLSGGGDGELGQSETRRRGRSTKGRLLTRIAVSNNAILVAPAQHMINGFRDSADVQAMRTLVIRNAVPAPSTPEMSTPRDGIVWYGREGNAKNPSEFLRLSAQLPDQRFKVIGKLGSDFVVPENADLLGWVDPPDALLHSSSVVLSTSLAEGSPNLCLQGLASGCVVVGYDIPALREIRDLAPDRVRLAPPGDTEAMAELVRTTMDSFDNEPAVFTAMPSVAAIAERWVGLFHEETPMKTSQREPARARSTNRALRLISHIAYHMFASRVPSRFRWFRPARVMLLRGYGCDVASSANINARARISPQCTIGEHAGVGEDCVLSGEVHLGPHVTMGPECRFITGDHPVPGDGANFRDEYPKHRPIWVEEDAFIAARVTILPGVRIGRGAAVGAGAVVAKDVAPGATVVGNPAKEVRRRRPAAPAGEPPPDEIHPDPLPQSSRGGHANSARDADD
jgi:maltose O-acetyltransferase